MANKPTILALGCLLILAGCYKEKTASSSEVILSIGHSPTTIPADGVSKSLITVEIPAETPDASNSIVLTTTKGLFDVIAKNTATISAQNVMGTDGKNHRIGTMYLVATNDTLPAIITATIKNYSKSDTVIYSRAYPSQIRISIDKLIYLPASNGEVAITVQIKRDVGFGTPTTGQMITLDALDVNNLPIGNFRNKTLVTDAAGNCVNFFSMPTPNTYNGIVKFRATVVKDAAGGILTDETIINVH